MVVFVGTQYYSSIDSLEQGRTLLSAIERVISSHMNFTLNSDSECDETPCDHVLEYARELLTVQGVYRWCEGGRRRTNYTMLEIFPSPLQGYWTKKLHHRGIYTSCPVPFALFRENVNAADVE